MDFEPGQIVKIRSTGEKCLVIEKAKDAKTKEKRLLVYPGEGESLLVCDEKDLELIGDAVARLIPIENKKKISKA